MSITSSLTKQLARLETALAELAALPPPEPSREEIEADLRRRFATEEFARFMDGEPASATIWPDANPGYDDELGDRFREVLLFWLTPPEERTPPAPRPPADLPRPECGNPFDEDGN